VADRLQRKRTPGSHLPEGTVCVDRTTKFGNPYKVGDTIVLTDPPGATRIVRDRADAVELFAAYIKALDEDHLVTEGIRVELRGKDLACWCPLPAEGEPDICHAAVLLAVVNHPED
jgi:hypothetical protein